MKSKDLYHKGIDWDTQLLGVERDAVIAKRLGVTYQAVYYARLKRKIPPAPETARRYANRLDPAWCETIKYGATDLGMSDASMARELGVSRERIRQIRNKTNMPLRGERK